MLNHLFQFYKDPVLVAGGLWAAAAQSAGNVASSNLTIVVGALATVLVAVGKYGIDQWVAYLKWRDQNPPKDKSA